MNFFDYVIASSFKSWQLVGMELVKAKKLKQGDGIGIFTPSSPSYVHNPEMYEVGKRNLAQLGFNVIEGELTQKRASQGYRSGTPKQRAEEFMGLIENPEVQGLMSTIGGSNSSSMIPYLDFKKIRESRKVICGYSDVTSLHLAILKYSRIKTFYGPALMTWFGDYPNGVMESAQFFWEAVTNTSSPRPLQPFSKWSNHGRDWSNGDWKKIPRNWWDNKGWKVLNSGLIEAPIVVANLNTLMSSAGTPYFPELEGKILLIEEMAAPFSREERSLRQLQLMGVFDKIVGLIFGKPEFPDTEGAPFSLEDLLLEIVGTKSYPIVSQFDCSHTVPMHTIAEETLVTFRAANSYDVDFILKESFVEEV
ncbi:MAG: LD-carboxypeptidase [Bdellovibrionales bacterium]|nr:LD-carboxypeptidase [Bdellovibrionales bacterium]